MFIGSLPALRRLPVRYIVKNWNNLGEGESMKTLTTFVYAVLAGAAIAIGRRGLSVL